MIVTVLNKRTNEQVVYATDCVRIQINERRINLKVNRNGMKKLALDRKVFDLVSVSEK